MNESQGSLPLSCLPSARILACSNTFSYWCESCGLNSRLRDCTTQWALYGWNSLPSPHLCISYEGFQCAISMLLISPYGVITWTTVGPLMFCRICSRLWHQWVRALHQHREWELSEAWDERQRIVNLDVSDRGREEWIGWTGVPMPDT